jgi:tripartite-type tricarboxylate transporter receptor subunit TctC
MRFRFDAAGGTGLSAAAGAADRAVPAGGGNDIVARAVAQELGKSLGQQFVVDNRAGAGGAIGAELAARSPPTATRCSSAASAATW